MDERREIVFNWRNAQVLGFLVGFIFPVGWFAAAFLPLPAKPDLEMDEEKVMATNESLEAQLLRHEAIAADIRYENARWWRGLNRFMCAVGVVVIAIVITLAILGTRTGGF